MTLPIVGSRYGFATYGYRTAVNNAGVPFTFSDFYTFLDAIGITSNHRAFDPANNGYLNFRFPSVDADIAELGPVTTDFYDGRSRARIGWFGDSGQNVGLKGIGSDIQLMAHTKAIYLANNNSPGSPIGFGAGRQQPNNPFIYAVGDSKGFAIFRAKYDGLNNFANQWGFTYFGYCDNPASVAFFGNNQSYPLDYIAYTNSNLGWVGAPQPNTPLMQRNKQMANPGQWNEGPAIGVDLITSINCTTPTPGVNISDLMFRDNGATDYGINYPLGRARPFLVFSNQNLAVNSVVRIINSDSPTPEDHFHIVVSNGSGGGSLLMPIITENYSLP
jgi:hypothetical protein